MELVLNGELSELVTIIRYLIVAVILVGVRMYVVPLLNTFSKNEKYKNLVSFIEQCVSAAEILVHGTGAEKKAYVTEQVKKWMSDCKYKLSDEEISILIEGVFAALDGVTVNKDKSGVEKGVTVKSDDGITITTTPGSANSGFIAGVNSGNITLF